MKAKRKGTEGEFKEIERVQLKGSDILYDPEVLEFDGEQKPMGPKGEEDKHWKELREKAAVIAMHGLLGSNFTKEAIAEIAIEQADILVKKLKEYDQSYKG